MPGIDWDGEFSRMNATAPAPAPPAASEKTGTSSKVAATIGKIGAGRHNRAALAVCGTIAVLAVCGTVVTVTDMQGKQAAQDRVRAQDQAATALVQAEVDKQRAQSQEAAAKTLYEREMAVYLECNKLRAAAVAKAASYDVARIPACEAPVLGATTPKAAPAGGAPADGITSSPWLWVALVGGAGLIAYKKLSAPSGSSATVPANNKGFTFEKGA
ncbi:hypothetical protein [Streptomyces sp. NPDC048606]|uniref:hypothetical protein n=1 Tax=Streptomyces sp. NPDC048606 TaxID=3154726 RepID=UPI00341D793E